MSTLTSIELSVSSIGRVIATAWVSDAQYPYYFSTSNIEKIKKSIELRRIKVPDKINVTTTEGYDRMTGAKSLRLVSVVGGPNASV